METSRINSYKPPFLLRNGHAATIWPALTRKIKPTPAYSRERIATPDDDFLDLDWMKQNASSLVIISHGLEGNSERQYVVGMANSFFKNGFDVVAWNFRGCGESINNQRILYHSGATDDLRFLVEYVIKKGYKTLTLIGFSLGGNLTLKFLGETPHQAEIKNAVTFSVPLDLHAGSLNISKRKNFIYERRFLRSLTNKLKLKAAKYPEYYDLSRLSEVKSLMDFDEYFTGPIHGFKGAMHYYDQCSSKNFIENITIPTLVVNALNDPFLPNECLDHSLFQGNAFVKFETPANGGHCGFADYTTESFWSEQRAVSFVLHDA